MAEREQRAWTSELVRNREKKKGQENRSHHLLLLTGLSWVVGDAEELPFDDDQFDFYTIAFGIRNVTHMDRVSDIWWRVRLRFGRARKGQL